MVGKPLEELILNESVLYSNPCKPFTVEAFYDCMEVNQTEKVESSSKKITWKFTYVSNINKEPPGDITIDINLLCD